MIILYDPHAKARLPIYRGRAMVIDPIVVDYGVISGVSKLVLVDIQQQPTGYQVFRTLDADESIPGSEIVPVESTFIQSLIPIDPLAFLQISETEAKDLRPGDIEVSVSNAVAARAAAHSSDATANKQEKRPMGQAGENSSVIRNLSTDDESEEDQTDGANLDT